MYDKDTRALIGLDAIFALEYKNKKAILSLLERPSELSSAVALDKIKKCLPKIDISVIKNSQDEQFIERKIFELEQNGILAITYLSSEYPKNLLETATPPLILYCKGNISLLNERCFGIVGSRKTLPYSIKLCTQIAKTLSENSVTVVTGTAVGADKAAILGAIDSGKIISVLASGHDMIYPEQNRSLIESVAKRGLVISEYPLKMPARSWSFPVRNRIIATLAEGVLICSGEMTSGARHTASYALEENRDVFAFPYSLGISSGELCNYLIKNGALLCDSADDILFNLGIDTNKKKEEIFLDETEKTVLNAIKDGDDNSLALIVKTGLKAYELATVISSLELKGVIVRMQGNKFKAIN